MNQRIYRYQFSPEVDSRDLETILYQAVLAIEALHGAAGARLDVRHYFDADKTACAIDATSRAGRDLSRVFAGLCIFHLGDDAFTARRVDHKTVRERSKDVKCQRQGGHDGSHHYSEGTAIAPPMGPLENRVS